MIGKANTDECTPTIDKMGPVMLLQCLKCQGLGHVEQQCSNKEYVTKGMAQVIEEKNASLDGSDSIVHSSLD